MKSINSFAALHGLTVVKVTYRSNGSKSFGYDLVDSSNNIQVTIAPVNYSNGDKWMVVDYTSNRPEGIFYMKSLQQITSKLQAFKPIGFTGFKCYYPYN